MEFKKIKTPIEYFSNELERNSRFNHDSNKYYLVIDRSRFDELLEYCLKMESHHEMMHRARGYEYAKSEGSGEIYFENNWIKYTRNNGK